MTRCHKKQLIISYPFFVTKYDSHRPSREALEAFYLEAYCPFELLQLRLQVLPPLNSRSLTTGCPVVIVTSSG
jgi:hypothetical protein